MVTLELTTHKYKPHISNSLVEIKYFFESYNELTEPTFTNPINGNKINIAQMLNPLRKKWLIAIGLVSLLIAFFTAAQILSGKGSLLLSISVWLSSLISAFLLLPALFYHFIHQIKHDHAKDQARFVAEGVRKTYRPDLTKVTDELLAALFADDSILTVEVFMLLNNLDKNINTEELIAILNYITNDEKSELLHLVIDENDFAESKINFDKIFEEGLGLKDDDSFIEDPKIIQLIIYSLVIRLLTNSNASGNLAEDFKQIDHEKLHHFYESYCEKFLHYGKNEYELETYVDEFEGRIMSNVVDLL